MDGLLKVHQRIIDADSDPTRAPPGGTTMSTRLLLAATQAGNLIGKQGATIKIVQDSSNCIIRVLGEGWLEIFYVYYLNYFIDFLYITLLLTISVVFMHRICLFFL